MVQSRKSTPDSPPDEPAGGDAAAAPESWREVRYRASPGFAPLLQQLHAALIVSTYQAGKLIVVAAPRGELTLSFHNFDRPMGVAYRPGELAVAGRDQVWFLDENREIAPCIDPAGRHDTAFLARRALITGDIEAHEMGWVGEELWIVNTLFSCLCTLDGRHSFVPRWRPPFVSALAAEDRCHLNGLAVAAGKPRFVTAMSTTDTREGWRPTKTTSGCLIDVESGRVVAAGFAMPHSPRVEGDRVLLLDSGRGQLVEVHPATGVRELIADLPGYTRGLALHCGAAFVGLSKIRETTTFGGVPIAEGREALRCGVGVVDIARRQTVATLEFVTGVDEVFDVGILPGVSHPVIHGPHARDDGQSNVWLAPKPPATAQ